LAHRTDGAPRRWRLVALLVIFSAFAHAGGAVAQAPDRAIEFEDLGFTGAPDVSSRGAGLSAFAATVSDATALVYNPAGLARVKRRLVPTMVLGRCATTVTTTSGGAPSGSSFDGIGLQFLGGAAAVPVTRGSFVPAVAVYRAFVSDLDLAYAGPNAPDARDDAFRFQQSGSTFAFALGAGVDLASAVSTGISVFALEGGFHSLRQSHTRQATPAPATDTYVVEDIDGDVDGIGARFGFELYAHRHLHLAAVITTPILINVSTGSTREESRQVENDVGSFVRTASSGTTEYIIPYRVDGGFAAPWGAWLVTAQVGVSDWSQAAIDAERLHLPTGDSVLGRVIDWKAGVEWTAPRRPLRVRAGAARLPFVPRYLEADRIDNDRLELVDTESGPWRAGAGAGALLRERITIDASYTRTWGERRAASMTESREGSQILVEGSYWF